MTVLTLPFVAAKPDAVPLVDDVDRESANAGYEPNVLEAGGRRSSRVGAPDLRAEFKWLAWKVLLLFMAFAGAVLLTSVLCRSYDKRAIEFEYQARWDVDGDARAPCKSYTSYADAENDMLSMAPSAASDADADADYDAGQFDIMEVVYKKLKNGEIELKENRPYDAISAPDEGYDVDMKFGSVPSALIVKPTRFIHDFGANVTGIIDVQGKRCYVMPLSPDMVSPPQSMNELLFKMSSGYYSTDVNKVIAQKTIVKPALADLSDYGLYISKDCANYTTYKLDTAGFDTKDIVFV